MIALPSQKIILPKMQVGMKGFMRLRCWRPDQHLNRCRIDTGFFPNLILTNGLENMNLQANWLTHCRVGTSSTAASAGQTQLVAQVASTSTIFSSSTSTEGSTPFFGRKLTNFRFPVGAGHGGQNLNEAGIGWGSSGSTLISRARIIDPITQLEATVTPLADEILELTYDFRYYPPLGDVLNTVTLNGVTYNTTTRAVAVTGAQWSAFIGQRIGEYAANSNSWSAHDGELGAISAATPLGVSVGLGNQDQYNEAYSGGSNQIVMVAQCTPSGWNLGSGIRCLKIDTTAGSYQTRFGSNPGDLRIPKTNLFTMQMKWVLGWAEYV